MENTESNQPSSSPEKISQEKSKQREYKETVNFLLKVPVEIWLKFVKTVPISRTRHDFIIDLIQRRIWEYDKSTETV